MLLQVSVLFRSIFKKQPSTLQEWRNQLLVHSRTVFCHPSLFKRREVFVTLCQRKRGWADISRPTTGAAVTPAHSFCPRSCVHRVASLQSWAEGRPQARWQKHVLSACPRLDPVMPKLGQLGPGRRETGVPAAESLGLVQGVPSEWREAACSLPYTPTAGNQQQWRRQQQQAVWQMQGPVECSPCSLPPCPAPLCPAACSPHCRRSSPP